MTATEREVLETIGEVLATACESGTTGTLELRVAINCGVPRHQLTIALRETTATTAGKRRWGRALTRPERMP